MSRTVKTLRPWRGLAIGVVVLVGLMTLSWSVDAGGPWASLILTADTIVVGRVIGPAGQPPANEVAKRLVLHFVDVQRTLMGPDESSERLAVRPNRVGWRDGETYILFLKGHGASPREALGTVALEATAANVDGVTREIVARGRGVSARRILSMRLDGGNGGLLAEFFVTRHGRFEWRRLRSADTPGGYDRRAGRLPRTEVARLIAEIEQAGPGPLIDDLGHLSFQWLDADGRARAKGYSAPDRAPAVDLLDSVDRATRAHAEP